MIVNSKSFYGAVFLLLGTVHYATRGVASEKTALPNQLADQATWALKLRLLQPIVLALDIHQTMRTLETALKMFF